MNYKDLLNDKDREIFNSIWSSNVWSIFKSQYGLSEYDIKRLMKSQMKLLFGMDDITPAVSLEKLAGSVKLIFGIEYDWMMR